MLTKITQPFENGKGNPRLGSTESQCSESAFSNVSLFARVSNLCYILKQCYICTFYMSLWSYWIYILELEARLDQHALARHLIVLGVHMTHYQIVRLSRSRKSKCMSRVTQKVHPDDKHRNSMKTTQSCHFAK